MGYADEKLGNLVHDRAKEYGDSFIFLAEQLGGFEVISEGCQSEDVFSCMYSVPGTDIYFWVLATDGKAPTQEFILKTGRDHHDRIIKKLASYAYGMACDKRRGWNRFATTLFGGFGTSGAGTFDCTYEGKTLRFDLFPLLETGRIFFAYPAETEHTLHRHQFVPSARLFISDPCFNPRAGNICE